MRAMILAAGRGERLRPITDSIPKALVEVAGKPLIEHHLGALSKAGFSEIVINTCYLGHLLHSAVGSGGRWGVKIHWSDEEPEPLETGGGIFKALPLLGPSPFLVVNADIFTDYPFQRLRAIKCDWAHLVLVPNPAHTPQGDFSLNHAKIGDNDTNKMTFSGIAVYHPRLFGNCEAGKFSVVPVLRRTMAKHLVTGESYRGRWHDVGTLDRLESVQMSAPARC